jgi:hypothetical protein
MKTIDSELENIKIIPPSVWDNFYFEKVTSYVKNEGLWLEFGVCSGRTINLISTDTKNKVYGFDSFLGLPEDWGTHQKKGEYSTNGNLPFVNDNVELVVGLFQDTLSNFLKEHPEPVSYLHLDADLYSSTKYVLNKLKNRIVSGTVISFDEIYNYPEYRDHEIKAWVEFVNKKNISYDWIVRTDKEQATCLIK